MQLSHIPSAVKLTRRNFQQLAIGAGLLSLPRWAMAISSPASDDNLIIANNRFALNFLQHIETDSPTSNQVFSPLSIESALLMTMEGAHGNTAAEMGSTLSLPTSLQLADSNNPWALAPIRKEMTAILSSFQRSDPNNDSRITKKLVAMRQELSQANERAGQLVREGKYQQSQTFSAKAQALADQINELAKSVDQYDLSIANSIWADNSLPVKRDFQNTLAQAYHAAIENVDFSGEPEIQRKRINDWVSNSTEQKIKDLLPVGVVTSQTRMVLANAVYFRGTWEDPFQESQTAPKPFFNLASHETLVPTMFKYCTSSRYGAFNSDGTLFDSPKTLPADASPTAGYPQNGCQVAELNYNGGELSMLILLPTDRNGLETLVQTLSAEKMESWAQSLEERDFQIELPKFKMEAKYDLKQSLTSMGMHDAFEPTAADFSAISPQGLFISEVLHKAFIEVNEKGTEAAAATAVVMNPTSARIEDIPFIPEVIANHPFAFLIRHRQSGLILFIGKVEQL